MSWTSVGFDGTINEAQWAGLAGLLGNGYVAAGNGDCLVTAVAGARSVSVAAGSLYGDGVLSTNSAPETVAMTTPVNGQWYVIALRRTWATNTAALVAIAGATTTTTTPTAPPTSFPTLNTNVGVLTDQPIAWAWCNSANTTVVVYDIRLKAVKSLPPVVANANERDAKFMSPTQGLQVWRDDLGAVETYYGLYNSSTNPGGRDTAGWYTSNRAGGLVPIKPTTVTISAGTGSVNALGKASFSAANAVYMQGVFSAKYDNYCVVFDVRSTESSGADIYLRLVDGSTAYSSTTHERALVFYGPTNAVTVIAANDAPLVTVGFKGSNAGFPIAGKTDVLAPFLTKATAFSGSATSNWGSSAIHNTHGGREYSSNSHDGILIGTTGGTIGGTIQVFGYNN